MSALFEGPNHLRMLEHGCTRLCNHVHRLVVGNVKCCARAHFNVSNISDPRATRKAPDASHSRHYQPAVRYGSLQVLSGTTGACLTE